MTSQRLGKYEVLDEIGRGSFATVYRARDVTLEREVALKVLHPPLLADPAFVERFQCEARTLAGLRHPHIVTVHDVGEAEGRLFIAMELAHGPNLAAVIGERGGLPWPEVLALLKPVCEALDHAHSRGVAHRDLKPANVLLDAERGPLLTDFGFAQLVAAHSASLSLSGGIVGTPAYIAPEVWAHDAATPAADIYAVGCIVYELLTGRVLFASTTPLQALHAHDRGPQFPAEWPAGVPSGVTDVLASALATAPENRFGSALALWHSLDDLAVAERQARLAGDQAALAAQWRTETEIAIREGCWSAARMALGRWLAVAPDDRDARVAQAEIERRAAPQPGAGAAFAAPPTWVWSVMAVLVLALAAALWLRPGIEGGAPTATPEPTDTPLPRTWLDARSYAITVQGDADALLGRSGAAAKESALNDLRAQIMEQITPYLLRRAGIVLTFGTSPDPREGNDIARAVNDLLREQFPSLFGDAILRDYHDIDRNLANRGIIEMEIFFLAGGLP